MKILIMLYVNILLGNNLIYTPNMNGDIALSIVFQEAVSLFASPPPVDTYGYTVVDGTCFDDSAAILHANIHTDNDNGYLSYIRKPNKYVFEGFILITCVYVKSC